MTRHSQRADPLLRSSLLRVLPPAARRELLDAGVKQRFAAGQDLFHAGDPGHAVQVLLKGKVRLWRVTEQGQALTLRVCTPGEVLGQMSVIDAGSHSVSATAEDACEVLSIPARAFQTLLRRQPELALQLARVLAARVRSLSDQLEAMKFSSVGERLRRVLLERGADRRELRLTHQQLADQTGASRENVSRVLGFLRDAGVVKLGRGRVEILDHQALEQLSF